MLLPSPSIPCCSARVSAGHDPGRRLAGNLDERDVLVPAQAPAGADRLISAQMMFTTNNLLQKSPHGAAYDNVRWIRMLRFGRARN